MKQLHHKLNYFKYTSALSVSLIGSEAFKLGASIYILRLTGDYWLVSILYLLIQIPSMIVYFFSHYLVQKIKRVRLALLVVDLISALVLIIFIAIFAQLHSNSLANSLIVINALLGLIHAFRFIFLKEIVYYVASNEREMKTYNSLTSLGTGFGFLLSPIMGLVLYKIEFEWLIGFNIVTYLLSGGLYFSLHFHENKLVLFHTSSNQNIHDSKSISINKIQRFYLWTYVLSGSLLLGIISFPKQSGLTQVFQNLSQFNYNDWSFYLSIVFSLMSLLGVILTFYFNKSKKISYQQAILWIGILLGLISLVWLGFGFSNGNAQWQLFSYLVIIAIQQFLFSIFLPMFYSQSYQLFPRNHFHKQNGISIVFRIIVSSFLVILFTFITKNFHYKYTYLTYSIFVFIICALLVGSYYKLQVIN